MPNISEIIDFLENNFNGDDSISIDIRWHDDGELYFDKELNAIFTDGESESQFFDLTVIARSNITHLPVEGLVNYTGSNNPRLDVVKCIAGEKLTKGQLVYRHSDGKFYSQPENLQSTQGV